MSILLFLHRVPPLLVPCSCASRGHDAFDPRGGCSWPRSRWIGGRDDADAAAAPPPSTFDWTPRCINNEEQCIATIRRDDGDDNDTTAPRCRRRPARLRRGSDAASHSEARAAIHAAAPLLVHGQRRLEMEGEGTRASHRMERLAGCGGDADRPAAAAREGRGAVGARCAALRCVALHRALAPLPAVATSLGDAGMADIPADAESEEQQHHRQSPCRSPVTLLSAAAAAVAFRVAVVPSAVPLTQAHPSAPSRLACPRASGPTRRRS